MPLVGVNGEPLLERAGYVYDGTYWRPLRGDVGGRLMVDAAEIGDSLAQGQLAAAEATIYTVPAATKTGILHLNLFNTSAVTGVLAFVLVQRSGGTARLIWEATIPIFGSAWLDIGPLSTGDLVRSYAGGANVVNYLLTGVLGS
jgi:hypothetical protein